MKQRDKLANKKDDGKNVLVVRQAGGVKMNIELNESFYRQNRKLSTLEGIM